MKTAFGDRVAMALAVSAAMANGQGAPSGPIKVGAITTTLQDVPRTVTLPARAIAFQDVGVRPRLGGVIEEILQTRDQSDELTTIARLLSMRNGVDESRLKMNEALQATLLQEKCDVYRGTGRMVTPGNYVWTSTGTVTVRFEFDNPHRLIIPGMILHGEIVLGTMQSFLVPQRGRIRAN